MIDLLFQHGPEAVIIRVDGNSLWFTSTLQGARASTLEGLKLSKEGVEKEFPDLKGNPQWKQLAVEKFRNHFHALKTEEEKVDYIVGDLKKHGYRLRERRKAGRRPEKVGMD